MSRLKYGVAIAALGLAMAAGAASAQTYDRLVVFGDSLSDNGNLALATAGAEPPAAVYPSGRFSDGPVFTEILGFDSVRGAMPGANVNGDFNLAFGGAITGHETRPDHAPGMADQLGMYQMEGGKFGAGDLVSVLGGANNIFQAFPAAAGNPATAAGVMQGVAQAAGAEIVALTGQIAAAGAGTIAVTNLPRFSATPQFSPASVGPLGAQLADLSVTAFNGSVLTGLNSLAAGTSANIIYVDLFKASDVFNANPAAFGVTNATAPCFNQVAGTICADASGYLYSVGVHPTATGHKIIASVVKDYIYYADAGAQAAVLGETGFRHREDALIAASERLSGRAAWVSGTALSMSASYDDSETDARGVVGASDAKTYSVRLALESGPSEALRFGFGGGLSQSEVRAGAMSLDVESIGFDVWAGWRAANGVFVNASAGLSNDNYDDFKRQTAIGPIVHSGKTGGTSGGARLQLGTWIDMGGVALSPRAALAWVSADVDAFYEQGAGAQYAYADRTVEALTGEVALRLEGGSVGGFGFFGEVGYRDVLDDRSDDVVVGIAYNPATPLGTTVEDAFGSQALINVGVQGRLFERVQVNLGYRGRFGDQFESHGGGLSFTLPLN